MPANQHAAMLAANEQRGTLLEAKMEAIRPKMGRTTLPGVIGTKEEYPFAKFDDIAPLMSTGDRLDYSGPLTNPISFANRAFTYSKWSHSAGVVKFDDDTLVEGQGLMPAGIYAGDIRARYGCRLWDLREEVKKNPYRWCWSHVCRHRYPEYDDDKYLAAFLADVGTGYGYRGILLQMITRTPGIQSISLLLKLHRLSFFTKGPSFCSWGVKRWASDAGHNAKTKQTTTDPVPGRDGNLCPPEDIAQSLIWAHPQISLIP